MRVAVTGGESVFSGPLDEAEVAYVDADAIPSQGEAEVAAVVLTQTADADADAARYVRARARSAAAALGEIGGPIEVMGSGAVAHVVRRLLRGRDGGGSAPAGIVELTGDPDAIVDATRRLADLGTLVLAGDPCGRSLTLELYPDVHLRGLRLVGVPDVDPGSVDSDADADDAVPDLGDARLGRPAPAGSAWYRVLPG